MGTSQISTRLFSCKSNEKLSITQPNYLLQYGIELVSLVDFVQKSPSNLQILTTTIRKQIDSQIKLLCIKNTISENNISQAILIGNPVLHHIFLSHDVTGFKYPPYRPSFLDSLWVKGHEVQLYAIQDVPIFIPRIIDAFVGSDALCLSHLAKLLGYDTQLLLDIGTNTEIILKKHDDYFVTSAPSGPAFEGMSLDCGMMAEQGAITNIELDEIFNPHLIVIGSGQPMGICGTGVVSAIAELLKHSIINENGSISRELAIPQIEERNSILSYTLVSASDASIGTRIYISQPDIRMVQQSKAAIFGAIKTLLDAANVPQEEIEYLFLTGSFGSNIDITDATTIGLFPSLDKANHEQAKHGALEGAINLSCMDDSEKELSELCTRIKYVPLENNSVFDSYYLTGHRFAKL